MKKLERRETNMTNFLKKRDLVGKEAEFQICDCKEHPTFKNTVLVLTGSFDGSAEHELTINSDDENMLIDKFGDNWEQLDKSKFYRFTAQDTGRTYNGHKILQLVIE